MSGPTLQRREALSLGGAFALAAFLPREALAAGPPSSEAQAAVAAAIGGPLDPAKRLAFLADDALIVSDDVPFAMDKPGYADHLTFLAAGWERCELALLEPRSALHGDLAVVSYLFSLRGRPKDAGFRLRPGIVTAACFKNRGSWQALGLHFGALRGQILDASPS